MKHNLPQAIFGVRTVLGSAGLKPSKIIMVVDFDDWVKLHAALPVDRYLGGASFSYGDLQIDGITFKLQKPVPPVYETGYFGQFDEVAQYV